MKELKWFVLTAVIVPKEYDLSLSNKIVKIKETMNMDRKSQLHWNRILKYDKKIQIYYVTNNKGTCNIFISTRNDNNKEKNKHLKEELMSKRKYHRIAIKCINNIKFIDNRERNLLQLADVCCSSFAQAIKYNTPQEWEYVLKLKANIWNYKGLIIGYGIKFYPPLEWFNIFPTLVHLVA